MQSCEKKAFLSCSFNEKDTDVNDLVKSICEGLRIECINVCEGYQQSPAMKAKEMIAGSHMFIAVITRRERVDRDIFNMPASVHDEISMAYALNKPVLLIKEKGVRCDGFLNHYGTHISFSRDKLRTSPKTSVLFDSRVTSGRRFRRGRVVDGSCILLSSSVSKVHHVTASIP